MVMKKKEIMEKNQNPEYGRQWISWRVRMVARIQETKKKIYPEHPTHRGHA